MKDKLIYKEICLTGTRNNKRRRVKKKKKKKKKNMVDKKNWLSYGMYYVLVRRLCFGQMIRQEDWIGTVLKLRIKLLIDVYKERKENSGEWSKTK